MSQDVCLVTGVGPGTGKALVERFAQGYRVAMLARNAQRLEEIEGATPNCAGLPLRRERPGAVGIDPC